MASDTQDAGRPALRLLPAAGRPAVSKRGGSSSFSAAQHRAAGRTWLAAIYPHVRRQVASLDEALDAIHDLLATRRGRLPSYAPPADPDLLRRWAEQDCWEEAYQRQAAVAVLAADDLSDDKRLRELIGRANQARDVLDQAYVAASSPDASAADVQRWSIAHKAWLDASQRVVEESERLRRKALEQRQDRAWKERVKELERALLRQYGDLGPQYRVLVRRLASAEIRLERAEVSGRDVETAEYAELTRSVRDMVGQLQKYTEAQKTELLKQEVNQAVLAVLGIVEKHIASTQPRLWAAVVDDVRRTVQEGAA